MVDFMSANRPIALGCFGDTDVKLVQVSGDLNKVAMGGSSVRLTMFRSISMNGGSTCNDPPIFWEGKISHHPISLPKLVCLASLFGRLERFRRVPHELSQPCGHAMRTALAP